MMQEFFIQTQRNLLHCCAWLPEGEPVGVVQVIHGIKEYAARYDGLARFLAGHGYLVVGEDHPGHGKSVGPGQRHGYLDGGWQETLAGIRLLHAKTQSENPGVPYFMLGHSMGSFLLRTCLFTGETPLAGALVSGTGWQPSAILPLGLALCRREAKRLGERSSSALLQQLVFGSYNKQFAPNRTPHDWLSRDEAVVDAYAADPLCQWTPSIQLCREMLSGIRLIQQRENLARMDRQLPVFFLSGARDPVGANGKGVARTAKAFRAAGMEKLTVRLYEDMRHEPHNELGRERVWNDVLQWLADQACGAPRK